MNYFKIVSTCLKVFYSKKYIIFLLIFSSITSEEIVNEESKPLLRVFPIYRVEECEWSISPFVCHKCILKKEKYAQKIYFLTGKPPYRIHGCFNESKVFYTSD